MDCDRKQKLEQLCQELAAIESRRQQIRQEIARLESDVTTFCGTNTETENGLCNTSTTEDKIKVFRSLFRGREDVYPRRFESMRTGKSGYQPSCKNEWVKGLCAKPKVKCSNCSYREYLPVTDDVIEWHLRGNNPQEYGNKDFTIGVYPMLLDEKCLFLAADFDKSTWQKDIHAYANTTARHGYISRGIHD